MPHQPTGFDPIVQAHRVVREATALVARSSDPAAIERALVSLWEILPGHFHAEERVGGYFDRLRRTLPGEGRIDTLVEDHRGFERDLTEILQAGARDEAWIDRSHAFARRLQDHERLEARLGAAGISAF